mmetsp:Transcript_27509/g.61458  ORF Transcript_27509/g.61458 Transcript_27509/m.61458 type:complete len:124 (+) Transcript_27509:65-436(+)|eukprot:CAMPEP_0172614892 /NCGR_PEP_ID=MMETSP1068-20121228/55691_1 /TAXON_ID=35684 /ORGANISM="Pseudopedinella elastica, Strain CCMP716" /LENGTH=123 /DNA_ID=CAMNT_0013419845 /DNA_START=64 /DNA_END=435 /DNA_ORIENTATION=+
MMRWVLAAFALFTAQTAVAFTVAPRAVGGARAWTPPARVSRAPARSSVTMMGKMAKFGIFSPVVLAAKNLLGEKELNKLRGQGITLHSQYITEFCVYVGCSAKTRGGLIKKAKTTGDELGFLI